MYVDLLINVKDQIASKYPAMGEAFLKSAQFLQIFTIVFEMCRSNCIPLESY